MRDKAIRAGVFALGGLAVFTGYVTRDPWLVGAGTVLAWMSGFLTGEWF